MINWQEIKSEYESTSCTMKALAEKFNVSPSTLRSRKKREDWQRKATENVATQNDIVATDKKGGQLNNKNAKNNAGGSAPKKNKNAVKTGEHETIYSEYLTDEEKSLFDKQVDSSLVLSEEIHLLRVRQARMLQRLRDAENGLNDNEKTILYELRGRQALIESNKRKVKSEELIRTEMQERITPKIELVMKIEEALTRVSAQLTRTVKQYEEIDLIYARTRYTIAQTEKALLNNDRGKRGENDGEGQTIINIIDDIG